MNKCLLCGSSVSSFPLVYKRIFWDAHFTNLQAFVVAVKGIPMEFFKLRIPDEAEKKQ